MPETRSSERLGDIEQRLDLQQGTIDSITVRLDKQSQDLSDLRNDLKTSSARFEHYFKEINSKLSSLSEHGKRPSVGEGASHSATPPRMPTFGSLNELFQQPPSSYVIPTKHSRVEFPRFDGDDFKGWAYRCRQFFEVDGTPAEQRIRLLSIHLEGHALCWHQTFMRHRAFSDVSWDEYFKQMEAKFSDVKGENPLITLKLLQQGTGLVMDYEKKFDELLCEVDIPEEVAINLFIGGLRPDIQKLVLNFAPTTLASATNSARMQEVAIQALHDNAPNRRSLFSGRADSSKFSGLVGSKLGPASDGSISERSTVHSPVAFKSSPPSAPPSSSIASSVSKPTKHLTKKEMDERRRKGLCYWCAEKYTPSHKCKEAHLFSLLVDEDDDHFEDALEMVPSESTGTINAIEGKENTVTLKLLGRIKNQSVVILVDTGSTHNVIDATMAKRLNLKVHERPTVTLTVADTRKVSVTKYCPSLLWEMGGFEFRDDFLVMKIGGYDAILGTQWLRTLGKFSMDMELKLFEFHRDGRLVELHGVGYYGSLVTEELWSPKDVMVAQHVFLIHVPSHLSLDLKPNAELSETQQAELQLLLERYSRVFDEPCELPPSRRFDHSIPLIDNKPINCRPYRYGPMQKAEIESQVQQMLSHGVIRESSSSFAAPVVLVQKKDGSWRFCVD
ncbi:uncharacterized protein LOC114748689 [Neltuma alba]|uniref:uncharacterized protein LOC114748689 n=1 Tax=Neltuma alba TaxID=207710 RepID=UPI0010A3DFF8|nr:uncharacterized protein LOC114748689 [Prosopis alba]